MSCSRTRRETRSKREAGSRHRPPPFTRRSRTTSSGMSCASSTPSGGDRREAEGSRTAPSARTSRRRVDRPAANDEDAKCLSQRTFLLGEFRERAALRVAASSAPHRRPRPLPSQRDFWDGLRRGRARQGSGSTSSYSTPAAAESPVPSAWLRSTTVSRSPAALLPTVRAAGEPTVDRD